MNALESPDLETLRKEIADVYTRRASGDLPERTFPKVADAKILELFRAVAGQRMNPGETIEQEHHVIVARTRLDQMVLKDSAQELASLFATPRRVVEVRTVTSKDVPVTCDARDQFSLVDLTYQQISAVTRRRRIRGGQLAAGVVISAVGLLGGFQLGFTGPVLVLLGAVGILHALLFPTRWIEISGVQSGGEAAAIRVQCLRKRSAKAMLILVKNRCSARLAKVG